MRNDSSKPSTSSGAEPAPSSSAPTGKARLSLTINDQTYTVRILDPDPRVARRAIRLTRTVFIPSEKRSTTVSYDVAYSDEFGFSCECQDWIYRRANSGVPCKHGAALKAVGLFNGIMEDGR